MMNTLLFKLGTLVFVGGGTFTAFLASGLCPDGKPCDDPSACATKAKVVMASTMEQTQDARVVEAAYKECAKTKQAAAVAKEHCAKEKAVAKKNCAKSQKAVAKAGCKTKQGATQVVQNLEQPEQVVN
jgi:hypothetical protein